MFEQNTLTLPLEPQPLTKFGRCTHLTDRIIYRMTKAFHQRTFAKKIEEFDLEMAKVIFETLSVFGDETLT